MIENETFYAAVLSENQTNEVASIEQLERRKSITKFLDLHNAILWK